MWRALVLFARIGVGLYLVLVAAFAALLVAGLADRLGELAPDVLASIKELVNDASQPLRPHLDQEKHHFLINLSKPAAGQAMEAFLSGRQRKD